MFISYRPENKQAVSYLLSRFVKVKTGRDQLVPLLGPGDQPLPTARDAVGDLLHGLGVVVVVSQQSLRPLSDVNRRGMGFLEDKIKRIN